MMNMTSVSYAKQDSMKSELSESSEHRRNNKSSMLIINEDPSIDISNNSKGFNMRNTAKHTNRKEIMSNERRLTANPNLCERFERRRSMGMYTSIYSNKYKRNNRESRTETSKCF